MLPRRAELAGQVQGPRAPCAASRPSTASSKRAESVYHPDGDALPLTHYCGQGNQARLRSVAASESRVVFQRFEATNLSAAQSVLDELVLELGSGRLRRIETYASASGERETTELVFHRAPPPAAP